MISAIALMPMPPMPTKCTGPRSKGTGRLFIGALLSRERPDTRLSEARPRRLGGGPGVAAGEPGGYVAIRAEVEMLAPRRRQHGGDVEVGDRERPANQP